MYLALFDQRLELLTLNHGSSLREELHQEFVCLLIRIGTRIF